MRKWMVLGLAAAGLGTQVGCDAVGGALGDDLPSAALSRVDLLESPNVNQMLGYGCGELGFGATTCSFAGLDVPRKQDLLFRFDVVFDVENPSAVPIPLVETLLGFTAFQTANLGSVCVSYCDPEEEDCTAGINLEGACDPGTAKGVKGPEDLIPSVEELVTVAAELENGVDPSDWQVLSPGKGLETHIQFDLGIDPMLDLTNSLLDQSVNEFLDGKKVSMEVPYTVEGTLFFDVPDVDKYAIGFGPFADTWDLDDGPGNR
jgi:hypothetical protein